MADLNHYWGGDISAAPDCDLATVDGITLGIQRVIRRIMTCPGEDPFHPDYGAGIPQMIGGTYDVRVLGAKIRRQIFLERCVARTPPPVITVTPILNGVSVSLRYTDRFAQKLVAFSFPIQARPVTQSRQTDVSFEVPA